MSSELRAQPWKLEPMETGDPTLGDWNLAPKDNKGSTEKINRRLHLELYYAQKSHYLKQFSHQPKEESIITTVLLMNN